MHSRGACTVAMTHDVCSQAIEEAQAEAAKNAAEVHRLKQELAMARDTIDLQLE